MKNPFRRTRLIDVFMCAGFPAMGALVWFSPDLAAARDLAPWIAATGILPIGGYLAGYRWV